MSEWKYIIADSGGSGTDWAFCRADGTVHYQKTRSLHPRYALSWTMEDWQQLVQSLPTAFEEVPLYFYGAGCGNPSTASAMRELLCDTGFGQATVFSDALGACRACCGKDSGFVAIMGTGSILMEYDGIQIVRRFGGFGSLLGDEGSGFYFGRLVLKQWLREPHSFSDRQQVVLRSVLKDREEVLSKLAHPEAASWIASLAEKFAEMDFQEIHQANCGAFLIDVLPDENAEKRRLHFVGSYACSRQDTLRELLAERGWEAGWFISHPIESLVLFHE